MRPLSCKKARIHASHHRNLLLLVAVSERLEPIILRNLWRQKRLLPVVLALFVALAWRYRQATPLFETPDEPAHFSAVGYIAQTQQLPSPPDHFRQGPAPVVAPGVPSYYAPPLYYWLAAQMVGTADTAEFISAVIPNPSFARGTGLDLTQTPSNKNMYVHVAAQRSPQAAWAVAMWRVRLLSLLLGVATVTGAYALAAQLWGGRRWTWTAVLLVALNPSFLYLSNGISNDTLLVALCTWAFVLMAKLVQQPLPRPGWREAALALLLGLGLLTKQTAVILLPPAVYALYAQANAQRWSRRQLLGTLLGVLAIAGVVGGWWYGRNAWLTDDWLGLATHTPLPPTAVLSERLAFMVQQLPGTFKSYWGAFGWATIFVHPGWYLFFGLLTLGGGLGWLRRLRVTAVYRLLWLGSGVNLLLLGYWLWRTAAPYGRLLFPVLVPLTCLLVAGWRRWLPKHWCKEWQIAVIGLLATLALLAPSRYLDPSFASLLVTELPPLTAVDATFGSTYRLLGYVVSPDMRHPGTLVTVQLYWQKLGADSRDLSTFGQLSRLDAEAQVAHVDTWLGAARYPSSVWRVDDVVRQTITLTVPETAVAPALYWLNVGVYDHVTAERLAVQFDGQPLADSFVRLAPLRVQAQTAAPPPQTATGYRLGAVIRLNGYTLTPQPDGQTTLTLQWESTAVTPTSWTVFVHVLDAAGNVVAQADHLPQGGEYTTNWWLPGDVVDDTVTLPLDTAVANVAISVGLYDPQTGTRLTVVDAGGTAVANDAITLPITSP